MQQNDPELLGALSQQTSTFEQIKSSRERTLEQAEYIKVLPENANFNQADVDAFEKQHGGLQSAGPRNKLGSANNTNQRPSLLKYDEQ